MTACAVSLIYSIFHGFGSGIASEKFGILLQNRGAGFNLTAGHPNELGGGKRPMHTIIPAMLADDTRVTTAFGVMGGAYQPCGHARFMSNLLDFGMDPQTAIDAPRCFADAGALKIERGYSRKTRQATERSGSQTSPSRTSRLAARNPSPSAMMACWKGASDPRKDGCALGY